MRNKRIKPIQRLADIDKLREAIKCNSRDLLLFELLIQTGVKISDLLKLKVSDLIGLQIGDRLPIGRYQNDNEPGLHGCRQPHRQ